MFLFLWLDWGDDISDFEKIDFLASQAILSVSSPCRSDLIWKFEKSDFWSSSIWLHTAGNFDIWMKMDCYTCFSSKRVILTPLRCILKISKFWVGKIVAKMTKKWAKIGKITNFQFWISRPIWPILMICELHKVSITFFVDNSRD